MTIPAHWNSVGMKISNPSFPLRRRSGRRLRSRSFLPLPGGGLCCICFPLFRRARLLRAADQLPQCIEIADECLASGWRETYPREWFAVYETLFYRDVLGLLELAQVHRQIAVSRLQLTLQLREVRALRAGEVGHNAEPQTPVNYIVDLFDVESAHVSFPCTERASRAITKPGAATRISRPSPNASHSS